MQIMRFIALSMLPIMLLGSSCNSMEYYEKNIQNNQKELDNICNKKLKLSNIKKKLDCTFYTEPKQNFEIDVNRMLKSKNNYKVQLIGNNLKFTYTIDDQNDIDMQAVCDGIKKYCFTNDKYILSLSDEDIKNNTELGIVKCNGEYCVGFYTKLPEKSILTYITSGERTLSFEVFEAELS